MAIYEDLVSKARLKVFLDEIKKHFPVSVNGKKQDANGNIVISNFGGASASTNGTSGLVPTPLKGQQDKVLKGNGTWDIVSVAGGGTGLTSSPSMLTNLGSTSAANVLQAFPCPGVTGVLSVANGGTGANTVAAAVQALLGSSAVGSSTKSIYYDGETLKACADSIGGGGIVAALLEQNGYVKFANGLILQWGVADNGVATQNWSKTITLPIAFSNSNYIVAGSVTATEGWYSLFEHSNKTTSSVLIFASGCWSGNTSRYADWFALGY